MLEPVETRNRSIADMRLYISADLRFASYNADNYGKKDYIGFNMMQWEYVQTWFYGNVPYKHFLFLMSRKLIKLGFKILH